MRQRTSWRNSHECERPHPRKYQHADDATEFPSFGGCRDAAVVARRVGFARAAGEAGAGLPGLPEVPDYRTWEDVYRQQWTWDRVVHCTHNRANCMSACAWNVYVKDGIVWREEQAHAYDEGGRGGVPDFFPRGCQKGACYSKLMVSPQRLRYPIERVGERGSGQWKRISWDEALDKVADGIIARGDGTRHRDDRRRPRDPTSTTAPTRAAEIPLPAHRSAPRSSTPSAGIGDMPMGADPDLRHVHEATAPPTTTSAPTTSCCGRRTRSTRAFPTCTS